MNLGKKEQISRFCNSLCGSPLQIPVFMHLINSTRSITMHAESFQAAPRLLTIRQAAELLNVSISTLYGWVWQRQIPFIKLGRCLRFDLQELEGFIRANRRAPNQALAVAGQPSVTRGDLRGRTRGRMPHAAGKG
jgi:excisionase family DNA binding protein